MGVYVLAVMIGLDVNSICVFLCIFLCIFVVFVYICIFVYLYVVYVLSSPVGS